MKKPKRRAKGEGSLIRRKGCRYWYASFYDAAGLQIRVSTKERVKQKAFVKLRKLMGKSESGEQVKEGKIKYGDIRAGLLSNYVDKGNKSLRVLADGTEAIVGLRQLDAYCGYEAPKGDTPGNLGILVARINPVMIQGFKAKRRAEGAGPAMINRSLQCLRRMLNIAREDRLIAFVPKIRLLKEPPARKGFLERPDFDKLLAALPAHVRPLITLLYYCGVRLGEAKQIRWPQVDLNAALIRLEEEQTKTGEERFVPIPDVLLAMLTPVQPKAGPVFDFTNLRTEWEHACAAVGLGTLEEKKSQAGWKYHKYEGLIVHDLRRSAISNLSRAGVPESVAMKISGHRTREVFRRYNIVNTADVASAMRAVEKSAAPISAILVQNTAGGKRKSLKA